MPRIDDYGFRPKFERLEKRMDKAEKIAYVGLGVGIAAVIIALIPLITK